MKFCNPSSLYIFYPLHTHTWWCSELTMPQRLPPPPPPHLMTAEKPNTGTWEHGNKYKYLIQECRKVGMRRKNPGTWAHRTRMHSLQFPLPKYRAFLLIFLYFSSIGRKSPRWDLATVTSALLLSVGSVANNTTSQDTLCLLCCLFTINGRNM